MIYVKIKVSLRLKIRIFNTNVKSVLLYGCETMKSIERKLQMFVNRCLRTIMGVWWQRLYRMENYWTIRNLERSEIS